MKPNTNAGSAHGDTLETPRFLVIQNGARHNYAIPSAFQRAGALSDLYTDFTATQGLGSLLARFGSERGRISPALSRRTPPAEIANAVRTSEVAFLAGQAMNAFFPWANGGERATRLSRNLAEQTMLLRGTGEATHVYTMLGEGGRFVRHAQEKGLGVVGDVYIALSADAIVADESLRFPDWSDQDTSKLSMVHEEKKNQVLLENSDLLVCPSAFVRDDLIANHGVDASRTCVIPYAVSPAWLSLDLAPETGRVLFAGSATLRKGIHYLAMAATQLKGSCEVVVAGGASEKVRAHPVAKDLVFLGHLSKSDMAAEFARADVFVFPSLAEGAASVTAEALGAGVPVVTTKAAGSIVRHGVDGIVVPERDPEALVEAVRSIVEDRDMRAAMSRAARERAQEFTWDSFAQHVIEETHQMSGDKL